MESLGAYETIRELSSKRNEDLSLIETGTQVDDTTMIEHIHSLQQDMIEAHTKKADLENTVRELKLRIQVRAKFFCCDSFVGCQKRDFSDFFNFTKITL